jgi:hypothetical protein
MPDRDAVQQIIVTFGQTIGIGDLGLDDDGYCCLVIDPDMVINIELDEAAQRLLLYSVVGRPDGERFPLLLEANYLGQGTGGGSLGLQPNTGSAVLSREVPLTQLQAADSEPVANTYTPPPQGGIRAARGLTLRSQSYRRTPCRPCKGP